MAQCQRGGIGGIGGFGHRGQAQPSLHHLLHLFLPGATPTGHGTLHLIGRVLLDPAAGGSRLGQRQPTGLPHAHGGTYVGLEEHLLDRHRIGAILGDQRHQFHLQFGQPVRQCGARRGADNTHGQRSDGTATSGLDDRVAAASEPWVDAHHDHSTTLTMANTCTRLAPLGAPPADGSLTSPAPSESFRAPRVRRSTRMSGCDSDEWLRLG